MENPSFISMILIFHFKWNWFMYRKHRSYRMPNTESTPPEHNEKIFSLFHFSLHFTFLYFDFLSKNTKEWNDQNRMHAHVWCAVSVSCIAVITLNMIWNQFQFHLFRSIWKSFVFFFSFRSNRFTKMSVRNKFEWIDWMLSGKNEMRGKERIHFQDHFSWNNATKQLTCSMMILIIYSTLDWMDESWSQKANDDESSNWLGLFLGKTSMFHPIHNNERW